MKDRRVLVVGEELFTKIAVRTLKGKWGRVEVRNSEGSWRKRLGTFEALVSEVKPDGMIVQARKVEDLDAVKPVIRMGIPIVSMCRPDRDEDQMRLILRCSLDSLPAEINGNPTEMLVRASQQVDQLIEEKLRLARFIGQY